MEAGNLSLGEAAFHLRPLSYNVNSGASWSQSHDAAPCRATPTEAKSPYAIIPGNASGCWSSHVQGFPELW